MSIILRCDSAGGSTSPRSRQERSTRAACERGSRAAESASKTLAVLSRAIPCRTSAMSTSTSCTVHASKSGMSSSWSAPPRQWGSEWQSFFRLRLAISRPSPHVPKSMTTAVVSVSGRRLEALPTIVRAAPLAPSTCPFCISCATLPADMRSHTPVLQTTSAPPLGGSTWVACAGSAEMYGQSESPIARVIVMPPGHARNGPSLLGLRPLLSVGSVPTRAPLATTRATSSALSARRWLVPTMVWTLSPMSTGSESPTFHTCSSCRVALMQQTVSVDPEVHLLSRSCSWRDSKVAVAAALSSRPDGPVALARMVRSVPLAISTACLPPWPSATIMRDKRSPPRVDSMKEK